MTPPTSIDGTDIEGVTINGEEVREITVNGQTVFQAIPDSGLTHRWLWDEGSGSTFSDTETATTGDIVGATWVSGAGNGGYHLDFDGVDDVADTNVLPPTGGNPRTIAMWINFDTVSEKSVAIGGYGTDNANQDFRWLVRNGNLRFEINGTGETTTLSPTVGAWEPTAVVVPSSSFSDIFLYHNGNTYDMGTAGTVDTGSNNTFRVGISNLNNSYYGDMQADDPVVWDRALSVGELDEWANATSGNYP